MQMHVFYPPVSGSDTHAKACEALMTVSPCSFSSLTFSGPRCSGLEESRRYYSPFLSTDKMCYGPKDSLGFSLSHFSDTQSGTNAQNVALTQTR